MRILMQNRPNSFDFPGGDTVQMLRTKEQLEQLGVKVCVDNTEQPDVSGYDLVHVFNTLAMPATYYQVINAKRQGKPVVYSTIYWNVDKIAADGRPVGEKSRATMNAFLRRITGREFVNRKCHEQTITTRLQQEAALLASDCLLPNAEAELQQIRQSFPRVETPARIIPNAVSDDVTSGVAQRFRSTTGIEGDFVLCLANVSPRKNQLRLAEACRSLGLRLVLVGGCDDKNKAYLSRCLKVGGDNVVHLGAVPHEAVSDALAACRVHVLASLVETPGLATLEAAACGKGIVVCDLGSVREYIGDEAHYCKYLSVDSIRESVAAAWDSGGSPVLAERILAEYTWRRAAEETLAAYEYVLGTTRQVAGL